MVRVRRGQPGVVPPRPPRLTKLQRGNPGALPSSSRARQGFVCPGMPPTAPGASSGHGIMDPAHVAASPVSNGSQGVWIRPSHPVRRSCPHALQSWPAWQRVPMTRRSRALAHCSMVGRLPSLPTGPGALGTHNPDSNQLWSKQVCHQLPPGATTLATALLHR